MFMLEKFAGQLDFWEEILKSWATSKVARSGKGARGGIPAELPLRFYGMIDALL